MPIPTREGACEQGMEHKWVSLFVVNGLFVEDIENGKIVFRAMNIVQCDHCKLVKAMKNV